MNIRAWMKKRIQELPTGEYVCNVTTLDNISAFDVLEPVVRCRDCKWFTPERFYEEEREYGVKEVLSEPPDCGNPERCSNHYDSFTKKIVPVHIVTDPDGFCAWSERKGDA